MLSVCVSYATKIFFKGLQLLGTKICWAYKLLKLVGLQICRITDSRVPSTGSVFTIYRKIILIHLQSFHRKRSLKGEGHCTKCQEYTQLRYWDYLSTVVSRNWFGAFWPSDQWIFKNEKIKNMPVFLITEQNTPVIHMLSFRSFTYDQFAWWLFMKQPAHWL